MERLLRMGGKMIAAILGLITGFIALVAGKARANPPLPPAPTPQPGLPPAPQTTSYNTALWEPFLVSLLPRGMPLQFAKNWIEIESGGNPCAIGVPGSLGTDGHPKEQGIAQLYNPDDFNAHGIPSGSLRKYCSGKGQACTRPLTSEEMAAQVKGLIALIRSSVNYVANVLATNGATHLPGWSPSGEGFWRLVKTVHGLPGITNGMKYVTAKLKRAPTGWEEFKDQILNRGVKLDSGTEQYRSKYGKVFENAETTAKGVPGAAVV